MTLIRIAILTFLIGLSQGFEIGKKYAYKYKTEVVSAEGQKIEKSQSFRFVGNAHIIPVWENSRNEEQLIEVALDEPRVQVKSKGNYRDVNTALGSQELFPIYIQRVKGEVQKAFCHINDNADLKNMKKAISNLLNRKAIDFYKVGGSCNVTHSTDDNGLKETTDDCFHIWQQTRKTKPVFTGSMCRTSQVKYQYHPGKESIPQAASVRELIEVFTPLWKHENISLHSYTRLDFEGEEPGIPPISANDVTQAIHLLKGENAGKFVEESYIPQKKVQTDVAKCDPDPIIRKHRENLTEEKVGTKASPTAFWTLLKCFKSATKKDIKKVLNNRQFSDIMTQLLDVVAVTGTNDAIEAAFETLPFIDGNINFLNRFILPFTFTLYPRKEMIIAVQGMLKKLEKYKQDLIKENRGDMEERIKENEKVMISLIAALGGLAKTLHYGGDESDRQLVEDVDKYLRASLEACNYATCTITYMKAIRSIALPSSKDYFLRLVPKGGRITYEALSALRDQEFHTDPRCERLCHRIFHQLDMKQDTQNRILAAEMLMDCYTDPSTLKLILDELVDQRHYEMKTCLSSRILSKMQELPKFRSDIYAVLREAKHYYALAQKGDSVFVKDQAITLVGFLEDLAKLAGVNATYAVTVELTPHFVVNRVHAEATLFTPLGKEQIFSGTGFAEGIAPFVPPEITEGRTDLAEEEEEEEEETEPIAVGEGTAIGISFPQFVIFNGTSDMMGLAFTTNDDLPKLKGNFIGLEVFETAMLQSGLQVDIEGNAIGSVSANGSFDLSLWTQSCKVLVNVECAGRGEFFMRISTGFAVLEHRLFALPEGQGQGVTNSQFYEIPFEGCVQVSHGDLTGSYDRSFLLSIPGSEFLQRITKRKKFSLPGRSYALHKVNNEMCNSLMKKGWL